MQKKPFDKYEYYTRAVQSPDVDVEFLTDTYRDLRKKKPSSMREDFCGTFALSAEWVKFKKDNVAWGLDLDPEPLAYGHQHYFAKLKPEQQERLHILKRNVMIGTPEKVDIIAAMNFSYFIFKSRLLLKSYFKRAYAGLKNDGIMILDCFGGALCEEPNEEKRKIDEFNYFWDQKSFNPVTHEALFYIHFQRKGEPKRKKVFTYDWRMWSIPELRDILHEVGFKRTTIYWEGTGRDGEGNGVFTKTEKGDDSNAWVAYIAAER